MADSIKINKLEIENVKRIKAVKIEPTKNGLTIVGGNNNQGKTSVLDSIAWALGGDRYKQRRINDTAKFTYCYEQWFGCRAQRKEQQLKGNRSERKQRRTAAA